MEEGTNVVSGISRTCSHEVTVLPDLSGALNVYVRGTPVTLSLNGRGQRSRASRHGGADPAGGEPQRMVAPMPGRIVRVLAKPGEHVVARQSVVVIEAMKMENELRSARDGVVAEMHAREGQLVEAGALLAVIARRPE
ncbi:MAG: biotin/lipoyl-binding protein [Acidobacteria bacterium]|nr:biotin/lipoyl-binding protein [Acidobacteriota bacterium]